MDRMEKAKFSAATLMDHVPWFCWSALVNWSVFGEWRDLWRFRWSYGRQDCGYCFKCEHIDEYGGGLWRIGGDMIRFVASLLMAAVLRGIEALSFWRRWGK